jgi:hypothetical protein
MSRAIVVEARVGASPGGASDGVSSARGGPARRGQKMPFRALVGRRWRACPWVEIYVLIQFGQVSGSLPTRALLGPSRSSARAAQARGSRTWRAFRSRWQRPGAGEGGADGAL